MKTIKLSLLILAVAGSLLSCKKGGFCHKGDGEIITEERNLTGFSEIELSTSANLVITQGDTYSVKIEASQNLMEIIKTNVSNSILRIKRKNNTCLKGSNPITVFVTTPDISRISVSGSGDIRSKNLITSNNLSVSITGSGDIRLDSLDVNDINVKVSGSGSLLMFASDTAQYQDIKISGSGGINALNMPVNNSKISISGSGNCKVNVIKDLDVKISGSGSVVYKGSPIINSTVSGSGSLKHY